MKIRNARGAWVFDVLTLGGLPLLNLNLLEEMVWAAFDLYLAAKHGAAICARAWAAVWAVMNKGYSQHEPIFFTFDQKRLVELCPTCVLQVDALNSEHKSSFRVLHYRSQH